MTGTDIYGQDVRSRVDRLAAARRGRAAVRRRWILPVAQLMRSTPHATNRYLDLLARPRHR